MFALKNARVLCAVVMLPNCKCFFMSSQKLKCEDECASSDQEDVALRECSYTKILSQIFSLGPKLSWLSSEHGNLHFICNAGAFCCIRVLSLII